MSSSSVSDRRRRSSRSPSLQRYKANERELHTDSPQFTTRRITSANAHNGGNDRVSRSRSPMVNRRSYGNDAVTNDRYDRDVSRRDIPTRQRDMRPPYARCDDDTPVSRGRDRSRERNNGRNSNGSSAWTTSDVRSNGSKGSSSDDPYLSASASAQRFAAAAAMMLSMARKQQSQSLSSDDNASSSTTRRHYGRSAPTAVRTRSRSPPSSSYSSPSRRYTASRSPSRRTNTSSSSHQRTDRRESSRDRHYNSNTHTHNSHHNSSRTHTNNNNRRSHPSSRSSSRSISPARPTSTSTNLRRERERDRNDASSGSSSGDESSSPLPSSSSSHASSVSSKSSSPLTIAPNGTSSTPTTATLSVPTATMTKEPLSPGLIAALAAKTTAAVNARAPLLAVSSANIPMRSKSNGNHNRANRFSASHPSTNGTTPTPSAHLTTEAIVAALSAATAAVATVNSNTSNQANSAMLSQLMGSQQSLSPSIIAPSFASLLPSSPILSTPVPQPVIVDPAVEAAKEAKAKAFRDRQHTRCARRLFVGNLPSGLGLTEPMLMDFLNASLPSLGIVTERAVIAVSMKADAKFAFVEFRSCADTLIASRVINQLTMGANQLRVALPREWLTVVAPYDTYVVPLSELTSAGNNPTPAAPNTNGTSGNMNNGNGTNTNTTNHNISVAVEQAAILAANASLQQHQQQQLQQMAAAVLTQQPSIPLSLPSLQPIQPSLMPQQLMKQLLTATSSTTGMPLLPLPPTQVVCLSNMVTDDDLNDDTQFTEVISDIRDEVAKFGTLITVLAPRPDKTPGAPPNRGVGKVFLHYTDITAAVAAQTKLNGRVFNGKQVIATYVPLIVFNNRQF